MPGAGGQLGDVRAGNEYTRDIASEAADIGTRSASQPWQMPVNEFVPVGTLPPPGHVPRRMYAQVIRETRLGNPCEAFQTEIVDVPEIGPDEVLVAVMAAGVNYNNVFAARGFPVNVIDQRKRQGENTSIPSIVARHLPLRIRVIQFCHAKK